MLCGVHCILVTWTRIRWNKGGNGYALVPYISLYHPLRVSVWMRTKLEQEAINIRALYLPSIHRRVLVKGKDVGGLFASLMHFPALFMHLISPCCFTRARFCHFSFRFVRYWTMSLSMFVFHGTHRRDFGIFRLISSFVRWSCCTQARFSYLSFRFVRYWAVSPSLFLPLNSAALVTVWLSARLASFAKLLFLKLSVLPLEHRTTTRREKAKRRAETNR